MPNEEPKLVLDSEGVEAISLKSRLPLFWRDKPRLWFAQFETMITSQKLSDENKFCLAVSQLEKVDVEQVGDIIMSPPSTGRYEVLKKRLLSVYEESANKQLQKLLNDVELGDQRPSQLLRRMRDLGRSMIPDQTLRMLWMSHLPSATRAVLSVSEESNLDTLAAMADKMDEQTKEISSICSSAHGASTSTPSTSSSSETKIMNMIESLTKEVAELRMDRARGNYRSHRSQNYQRRARSRSRSSKRATDICFYHQKFGKHAYKCLRPCNYDKTKSTPEN